jgi:short subunit dehydrogenase-like uncharacterized protein
MIVIYGATGTTGALVARALVGRGLEVVLAGRDHSRLVRLADELGGVQVRRAEVHDEAGLAAALRGARVVVACAGPFLLVGEPVLRAALAAGAHYIDVSGEQAFLREAYEQHDSRARRAGLTAVPGFAWEVAVGDWAASRAAALAREQAAADEGGDPADAIDEVIVAYALSRVRTSRGTRESLLMALSRPASVWIEDRWERAVPLSRTRRLAFPAPFGEREALLWPSGEAVTVPRHVDVRRVETYLTLGEVPPALAPALRLAGLAGPLLALAAGPLGALARARAGAAPPPDDVERQHIEFAVVAEASLRFRRARVAVSGTDPYALSARIAALGALRLLEGGTPAGVIAPSQLTDPAASLATLVGEGLLSLSEY